MAKTKVLPVAKHSNERVSAYISIAVTALLVFYIGRYIEYIVTTGSIDMSDGLLFWTAIVLVASVSEVVTAFKSNDQFVKIVITACVTATLTAIVCCIFAILGVQM